MGDGGLATEALIGTGPYGLAIDSQDRLYIVYGDASRVRRVNLDGTIETIARNGLFGYNGDGQQATDARLNWPSGIFIDENDRVFIADRLNHRIRVVEQVGIISTIVSPNVFGFPATSTPIEVLDRLFSGTQTPDDIDNHLIFGPIDLDADADGALYTITGRPNQGNAQSIFRISSTGSAVEMSGRGLFAGTGIFPAALAATPEGRVYYTQGSSVRWVDSGGTIQTIAGAQTGTYDDNTPAMFADQSPSDIAFAPNGDVVVLNLETDRVRRIDSNGTINTIAGTGDSGFKGDGGSALQARLNTPVDAEFDSQGNLYIHDLGNQRIRKVDTNGIITTFAGGGVADGMQATQAVLQSPASVAITKNGVIYISDSGNHRIRRVGLDGVISTYAGTGKSGFDGDNGPPRTPGWTARPASTSTTRATSTSPTRTITVFEEFRPMASSPPSRETVTCSAASGTTALPSRQRSGCPKTYTCQAGRFWSPIRTTGGSVVSRPEAQSKPSSATEPLAFAATADRPRTPS